MGKIEKIYDQNNNILIGEKDCTFVNVETGEELDVRTIVKLQYGTKAFWKCYLMDFMQILGIIESRQLDVLVYVLEHTNQSTNMFIGTQRKIADSLNCSIGTVETTFKKLIHKTNCLTKVSNGVYAVNPNILVKGNDKKRGLLIEYHNELANS